MIKSLKNLKNKRSQFARVNKEITDQLTYNNILIGDSYVYINIFINININ